MPFHPIVARWFSETLGRPTLAQQRGWDAIRSGRHTLIAAPTGSGKTLAAFLTAFDGLFQEGLLGPLADEVRVVYVSPLKALSADIHKNLAEPRRAIRHMADQEQLAAPHVTAAVRTGDTTQSERAAMLRKPPHILVTTPESLYLLVTSERSRSMLRTARTVIVDEIHAVVGTRRGAHLALTLERLQQVADAPLLRVGLSATQKPLDEVARFLVGGGSPDCTIVNEGHRREMDLDIELPRSPLEAVMAREVWEEYYSRLAELIAAHRTTLVFVNTRRMAERVARHLSDRLGEHAVDAHHGSLSKEKRLHAEGRLKNGELKALVATASLELGIDIGHVDLVCQIGSPHRVATLLQRAGRSGHAVSLTAKARLFPVSRDDLVECAALLRAVRRGELDASPPHDAPLDVLTQQIVAETACREYTEDELYALVRRAWPYRALTRPAFDAVVKMASEGFATRRGRRSALLHRDEVHSTLRARRAAHLLAMTSGGAIPEVADYRVVLEPGDTFIGTVNEDFAIESMVGDIFQLGNASWQVLRVGAGVVRVADAKGAPPNIPFWLGEAPPRSDELSLAVSDLHADVDRELGAPSDLDPADSTTRTARLVRRLAEESGISAAAAGEAVAYLADARRALGVLPTQDTLVLERFFDESGGMQLVLHAPFGSRINKAWGLALRKRFCRQFNFELQAAATDAALLLSLGPQHSFPLADVFRYLHPSTVRDVLVQAVLDAPLFQTRWRWNTTVSLAVPRSRGGRKVPPQLQRMLADDLLAAAFPDAAACLENITGDRQLPDHPLVAQTVRDCLEEAMDIEGLKAVLARIHQGDVQCIARDTPEPSPLAADILNAKPYAFLDDAPLEERRTRAVYARRGGEASSSDIGALDQAAIERVRLEERPDPRDADELHDALLTAGFLAQDDVRAIPPALFGLLATAGRAAIARFPDGRQAWVAAERLPELFAVHPGTELDPPISAPTGRAAKTWTRGDAIAEIVRGRLAILGPVTASSIADSLAVTDTEAEAALLDLESEGAVLRGSFTVPRGEREFCDRALLARIHRYTLNRLRAEIEPVSPADFMRFLFVWQHVDPSTRLAGLDGLRHIVQMLDGFEVPAAAWERTVLPSRVDAYEPAMLDGLCLSGEAAWARLSRPSAETVVAATPIALMLREHGDRWQALRGPSDTQALSEPARTILDALGRRGASFLRDIANLRDAASIADVDGDRLRGALAELVAAGLAASDSFAGLRLLIAPPATSAHGSALNAAGRWSVLSAEAGGVDREAAVELQGRSLLRRYGVIGRRLLARETNAAPWRELVRVYRRLEARGEIRGGRFVSGMSGEQFALADAVDRLRDVRRTAPAGRLVVLSAADPLNLTGIVTVGERVKTASAGRVVFQDGAPLAALEGDYIRPLADNPPSLAAQLASALTGRQMPPVASGYVGR